MGFVRISYGIYPRCKPYEGKKIQNNAEQTAETFMKK